MKRIYLIIFITLCIAVAGCSKKKNTIEDSGLSAEELYNNAMDKLEARKYKTAISLYEEVERNYPYSEWATRAQIMSAYTSYRDDEYDDAIIGLERFIKLHPGNEDVPYAYYLKALCYYEQISDVGRDQSYTEFAKDALSEVTVRFPGTEYARDSKIKLDLVIDHLAGKELEVGRFYLKQHKIVAAINRFKTVVEKYQTTSHVAEALHRLVEAYTALGVTPEAEKYASVLGYNYPGSKWYERSYRLVEGKVLDPEEGESKWRSKIPFLNGEKKEKADSPADYETPSSNDAMMEENNSYTPQPVDRPEDIPSELPE